MAATIVQTKTVNYKNKNRKIHTYRVLHTNYTGKTRAKST